MKGTLVTKVYQVVVYHNVTNPEKLAAYAELAGPAMKSAGATFLARGIPYLVREEGVATRTVLIEWPSREAADAGYNSPEYQPLQYVYLNPNLLLKQLIFQSFKN